MDTTMDTIHCSEIFFVLRLCFLVSGLWGLAGGDGNLTRELDVTIVFSNQKFTLPHRPVFEFGKSENRSPLMII